MSEREGNGLIPLSSAENDLRALNNPKECAARYREHKSASLFWLDQLIRLNALDLINNNMVAEVLQKSVNTSEQPDPEDAA